MGGSFLGISNSLNKKESIFDELKQKIYDCGVQNGYNGSNFKEINEAIILLENLENKLSK